LAIIYSTASFDGKVDLVPAPQQLNGHLLSTSIIPLTIEEKLAFAGVVCEKGQKTYSFVLLEISKGAPRSSAVKSSLALPFMGARSDEILLRKKSERIFEVCSTRGPRHCVTVAVADDFTATILVPSTTESTPLRVIPVDSKVTCFVKTATADKSSRLGVAFSCAQAGGSSAGEFRFSLPALQGTSPVADPFRFVTVLNCKTQYRLLGATSSGLVFMLQFRALLPVPQFDETLWEKDEWAGHITQAVVLDVRASQLAPEDEEADSHFVAPTSAAEIYHQFKLRLSLQKEDLKVLYLTIILFPHSIPFHPIHSIRSHPCSCWKGVLPRDCR
jgi:hypothetical protein